MKAWQVRQAWRRPLLTVVLPSAIAGCGHTHVPASAAAAGVDSRITGRPTGDGRPPLAVVLRDGDAQGALAVAVTTAGLAPERGALAGVALAALVEARLAGLGVGATAVGGWDGWRLRLLVAPGDAARVVGAVRSALLTPVVAGEPALMAVARKAGALGQRPLPDAALLDLVECTGEAYGPSPGPADPALPSAAELESWRRAAHGLGRLTIATVGDATLADAATQTLGAGPAWPRAAAIPPSPWPAPNAPAAVYDASGELMPGAARILVTLRTASPERAVAVAPALGDPRGPLASRLAALETPGAVTSVVATAHVDGGCLAATIDLAPGDLGADAAARIAIAAALARQELAVEVADGASPRDLGSALTTRAADPRDAAERAAWWSLAGRRPGDGDEPRIAITVGVASARDVTRAGPAVAAGALRAEIDRATVAWHAPVLDARTAVAHGQGEAWVLLASPCGAGSESVLDAGIGAAVAMAATAQATDAAGDAEVEPFIDADGIGLLAHGPARAGESPQAQARRLADVVARAFAADALEHGRAAQARMTLIGGAGGGDARALGVFASAIAPGHPSWLEPDGTVVGLAAVSDDAVAVHAAALRAGPMRVAVVANGDATQAEAAVRAADRWVARSLGQPRACPAVSAPLPPRPGTYAVDEPAGGSWSTVLLGAALPAFDPAARVAGAWLAAALDGPDGLLAHALGGGFASDGGPGPMAQTWSATVLGARATPALIVRLGGPDGSLDGAVAQVRALFDRLRQGALRDEDRVRAAATVERARLTAALDPRSRVVDLWRGVPGAQAPTLDALRAIAASVLRDEALVIVASRPPPARAPRDPNRKSRN